jgi:pyruvate/2-oxoglutarate dehydrogenase complex dihydrolipoamide acyltransferase (E2) component
MRSTIKMPRVADNIEEVYISEWLVAVGSSVAAGDVLMRVETDKAVVEVPTPIAGVLTAQLVAIDDEVMIGTPIAQLET